MEPGIVEFTNFLSNASPIALFAFFIIALLRRWLILPRELDERDKRIQQIEAERDEYKELAYRALNISERIIPNNGRGKL